MSKFKFAFVGSGTIHANATLQRLWLAKHLLRNGHEVHTLLLDAPENRNWVKRQLPGVKAHYLFANSLYELAIKRRSILSRIKPDIIHILGIGVQNILTMPFFKKNGQPIFIPDFDELKSAQFVPYYRKFLNLILEKLTLHNSQAVIAASKFLIEHISRHRSSTHKKSLYLPYAYDSETFTECRHQAKQIQARYSPRKLLVYMGNLYKAYQGDQVLLLAEQMRSIQEKAVFLILGGGPELEASKKWVSQKKLDNYVHFLGYIAPDKVPAYLIAADVLLFPIKDNVQNRARCPNKTFQYIGANRPIVTNRVGEVQRAIGSYGYYYDFESIKSFEKTVLSALTDSASYDASDLLKKHTWKRRSTDYEKWLSADNF